MMCDAILSHHRNNREYDTRYPCVSLPCSIGHPPHSSASPVKLRLRVGPRALRGKKELREQATDGKNCSRAVLPRGSNFRTILTQNTTTPQSGWDAATVLTDAMVRALASAASC